MKAAVAQHNHPYWLDQIAHKPVDAKELPRAVDVLVVGSGYTGLNAAIETARGGRSTLVIDAEEPGFGCSTRNGGQISTSVKPSLGKLTSKFGEKKARAIRSEGEAALAWIGDFIEREGLDCDFKRSGRFHAAHTPGHYEKLARDADRMRADEGIESAVVPRSEQHRELGTDAYFGGVVFPAHCALQPAKLTHELIRLAQSAGVEIIGHCPALSIERGANGFFVSTGKGRIRARDVVIATNGYSGPLNTWLQRRLIPIGSYVICTQELPQNLMDELFPRDRIASDSCKVVYYYRPTPDRKRIIFGGRVSARETDMATATPRLYRDLCRIFPQLDRTELSHAWSGYVAYTFDELAHAGQHEGQYFAAGYCGSGVSMAGYLGMRLGQKVLGLKEGRTAFDDLPFPTRPLYSGTPWFLPAAVSLFRFKDAWQWSRALKNQRGSQNPQPANQQAPRRQT